MTAGAYWLRQRSMIACQGDSASLAQAVGRDWKGRLSPVLYVLTVSPSPGCPG